VRILTLQGVSHDAEFEVEFTEDWPEGVSWRLSSGEFAIPFSDVVVWSPDPAATPAPAVVAAAARAAPLEPGAVPPAITFEIEHELGQTEAVLRCIPAGHLDWTPHPAVPTLRALGERLVRIVARIGWILELDALDLAFEPVLERADGLEDILTAYQANEEVVRTLARAVTGALLRAPWTLDRNGSPVASVTRGEALRRYGLTPVVYHRGEIGLMLAAIGVPAPHPYPEWTLDRPARPAAWVPPGA